MSAYHWIITEDIIDNGTYEGTEGPHDCDPKLFTYPRSFQLYDDDGILYAKGMIYGQYAGFEPLDDFGTPNWGCSAIAIDGEML